ncbi:MAG TPA: hypothetical protein VLK84_07370 [Longimicrobium sp.]|nr:hypothetical protein [Longimicrobium sp.]
MSHLSPGERGSQMTLLIRSRSLRRRAGEVMERAAALRERSGQLLKAARADSLPEPPAPAKPEDAPVPALAADADDADTLHWYRAQVREMLAAGWSAQELADVGVTDGLLRELGLHGME